MGDNLAGAGKGDGDIEVSVVIPCLNEAETVGICVEKARRALSESGISHEVLVVDNGSVDESGRIAADAGARVICESGRGYGAALRAGIGDSRGGIVLMGDADDSYDFLEAPKFIAVIREGFDLVQGCRFPGGGGFIAEGAMPFSHRWIGNPTLTILARIAFGTPVKDIYCGMRAFRKEHVERLDLECSGMEFAVEMIIKSAMAGGSVGQVPITLRKDGRVVGKSHLRTFRDGLRTLGLYFFCFPAVCSLRAWYTAPKKWQFSSRS